MRASVKVARGGERARGRLPKLETCLPASDVEGDVDIGNLLDEIKM